MEFYCNKKNNNKKKKSGLIIIKVKTINCFNCCRHSDISVESFEVIKMS